MGGVKKLIKCSLMAGPESGLIKPWDFEPQRLPFRICEFLHPVYYRAVGRSENPGVPVLISEI